MLTSRWVALLALSVAMLLPSAARADDPPPVPLRLVDRPLTLPSGVLRGDLGFSYLRFGSADGAGASVSGGYGITDDLEVDATVLPLALAPALQYGNPTVSGTYRFVHERAVEVGGSLGVTLITRDTQLFGNATLAPSVPVLLRLGDLARIDTGVVLPITVGGPSTLAGLWIPATATFQILDPLYLGATTGLGM